MSKKKDWELTSHYSEPGRWKMDYLFKKKHNALRIARRVQETGGQAKVRKNPDPIDFSIWPWAVYTKNHKKLFKVRGG